MRRALVGLVLCAALLAGCGGDDEEDAGSAASGGTEQLEQVTWDLAMVEPVGDYKYEIIKQFADDVETRTDGGMKFTLHPGSELYGAQDVWPALFQGQVPIAVAPTVGIGDAQPQLGVANLPFVSASMEEAEADVRALTDFYVEQLDALGAKHLMTLVWPPNDLFTKDGPVAGVDAWDGMKIRAFDVNSAGMVEALGAEPTTVEVAELYQAMQRGLADGAMQSAASSVATKMYEIVKFQNLWNFTLTPTTFLAVNNGEWDGLPTEYQDAILAAIEENGLQDLAWEQWYTANEEAIGELEANGVEQVEVPESERQAAAQTVRETVWEDWKGRAGEAGQQALDIVESTQ
jgi:TRAP-type transport system periplasmic protein